MPLRSLMPSLLALLLLGGPCLTPPALAAQAPKVEVPALTDLRADLAEAGQRDIPILLLLHRSDCSWCHFVLDDHLRPMVLSGQYTERVLIRQLEVDGPGRLIDQDGREVSAQDFARRMKVNFYPTVLILGPDGQPLVEPLIGVANTELYGTQLESALQKAEARLK